MIHSEVVKSKRVKLLKEIKDRAKAKGLTQEVVGLGAGIKSNNTNRVLQGKYPPYLDTVIALADAAGLDLTLTDKAPQV